MNTTMKSFLLLILLTELITFSCSQIVINGDTRVFINYRRNKLINDYNKRKEAREKTSATDASDQEMVKAETKRKNLEFKERGSKKLPNGKPIPGNENLDSKIIDPRTPKNFGNAFMRKIHKTKALMSKALREDDTTFWNVTINVTIHHKLYHLPITNGDFSDALSLWYVENYIDFVQDVEKLDFDENCYLEMDADTLAKNYVTPHCRDHCHCFGHNHECCTACQYGDITHTYECQYYKVIADAQFLIAQDIMHDRRRKKCFGRNANASGGENVGKTKKEKMGNPVELAATVDHPMGMDIAISRGVF